MLLDSPTIFLITHQNKGQDADKDKDETRCHNGVGRCGNVSERQFSLKPRGVKLRLESQTKLGRVQRLGLERVLVPTLFGVVCVSARKLVRKSPSFPGLRLRTELDAPVPRCRAESSLIGLKTCRLRTSYDVGD